MPYAHPRDVVDFTMTLKDKAAVLYISLATGFATAYGIHNTIEYFLSRKYYCLKCRGEIK